MDNDRTVLVNFEEGLTLEQAYLELGKAYYEGGFEDPLPELLPLFDKITRLKNQSEGYLEPAANIAELKPEIPAPVLEEEDSGAGTPGMFCTNCGAPLEPGAVFCGNCGSKMG